MSLRRVEVDAASAGEWLAARGFTDGLPVVAPTPGRVDAMLAATTRPAGEVLGVVPPAHEPATVEKVAVCAVLAGCEPRAFGVVLAAVDAMLSPAFRVASVQATTSPAAPFVVVDGPAAAEAGVESGTGCFGPAVGANTTIGRALRLVLLVLGGGRPGDGDPATHGMPAKLAACIAERHDASPWPTLAARRGVGSGPGERGAVTAFAITGTWQISEPSASPDDVVHQVLHGMISPGHCSQPRLPQSAEQILLVSPGIAAALATRFADVDALQQALWEAVRLPIGWLPPYKRDATLARCAELGLVVDDGRVPVAESPDEFAVLVAGGDAGVQSFGMSTLVLSRSATVPVRG